MQLQEIPLTHRAPPTPADEARRIDALRSTRILDSAPEAEFEDIVRIAAEMCGMPIATVTLVDTHRQWFKARVGITPQETAREVAFCAHGLTGGRPLVVADALADARFAENPLVTGDPSIRFYAGIPLHLDGGSAIGTLCVMDRVPRELTPGQLVGLEALGRQVATELRSRREVALARPASDLPVALGAVVAGYRLDGVVGRGGGGVVMTGVDAAGRRGAVKFLGALGDPAMVARFVREAQVLLDLRSPHTARIFDVGDLPDGTPYIVMEHLLGMDLARVLAARGPVAAVDVVAWARQAAAALGEAHALGVVHRDVKPSNLFLAGETLKVLDFGVAKVREEREASALTHVDHVVGTTHYIGPEQLLASSEVDGRADVWSLGVVMYELLTGRLPFDGKGALQVCAAILAKQPIPVRVHRPDVPPALEQVILGCLAKDAEDRTPGMMELEAELSRLP